MSTPVICLVAVLAISLAYTATAVICRRAGRPQEEPRAVVEDGYEGPDSLRLLQDLEAHMKAYGAAVADYYDTTTGGPQ